MKLQFTKATQAVVPYLEKTEMDALLNAADCSTAQGRRDYTLLLFLYNSGARASEAVQPTIADIDLAQPAVRLLGKVCHSYYISFRRSDGTSACRRRPASFG